MKAKVKKMLLLVVALLSWQAVTLAQETIPYSTSFDDATDVATWTIVNYNNDGYKWSSSTSSGYMSYSCFSLYSSANDYLISPKLSVTTDNLSVTINAKSYSTSYTQKYSIYILTSPDTDGIDNNATQVVATQELSSATAADYTYSFSAKEFKGEDIYIAIRCESDANQYYFYVYDFSVAGFDGYLMEATAQTDGAVSINDTDSSSYAITAVEEGNSAMFVATPNDGFNFISWVDTEGSVVSTKGTYIIDSVTLECADGGATLWPVGANTFTCSTLNILIAEDGTSPEISISDSGSLTAGETTITHAVAGTEWKLISLPFAFNLADIIVDGETPVYGTNVVIQTYNAAKRAASYEGYTVSGWEYITSGTIPASQGFAITIDAELGESKDVVFTATETIIYTGDDQAVSLDLNASTVNGGMDANWNFIGTPLLEGSTKGEGYSLYIYDGATNSYKEYASAESASITPHGAMFLQGDTDFTSMTFSAGATINKSAADVNSKITLTINGADDEARMLIVDGSSAEFVINEDAMYFAPVGSKVSQIYFVDQNSKSIAASVVPTIAESTKVVYTVIEAGAQSISMTTNVTNSALYLEDVVTGTSTLMTDGTIYEFESAAGTVSNRFTLVAEGETTGIESVTSSDIKVVAASGYITVLDAEIGADIAIFSTNGTMLYNGVITSPKEIIPLSTQGILIVKVANSVIKVVM